MAMGGFACYFKGMKAKQLLSVQTFLLGIFCLSPLWSQDVSLDKIQSKMRQRFTELCGKMDVPIIKAEELMEWEKQDSVILIDVREAKEQKVSMLPNALSTKEFAEKYRKGLPDAAKIVVYCTIGYRSGKYAEELQSKGIKAYNLMGGVLAWSHAHGSFLTRDTAGKLDTTLEVHVYSKEWNFLSPDYKAIY